MKLTAVLQEHKEISITNPTCFGQVFSIKYTNCLVFYSLDLEKKVQKKLSRRFLNQREKWLGCFYAKDILCGCQVQLTIAWINQKAGYGVFANQEIARNTCIGEYTGLIRKRSWFEGDNNIYCFEYPILEYKRSPYVIDARSMGNHTRFINHSTEPNIDSALAYYQEKRHIILYANKDIHNARSVEGRAPGNGALHRAHGRVRRPAPW
ncbi:MAG: SET domain-containing protein-lysine N-methyltransferase, partial [Verrucomicrobiota bacterium]